MRIRVLYRKIRSQNINVGLLAIICNLQVSAVSLCSERTQLKTGEPHSTSIVQSRQKILQLLIELMSTQSLSVNLQVRAKEPSLCASLPTWLHTVLRHEWLENAIGPALPGRRVADQM